MNMTLTRRLMYWGILLMAGSAAACTPLTPPPDIQTRMICIPHTPYDQAFLDSVADELDRYHDMVPSLTRFAADYVVMLKADKICLEKYPTP